ncbi:MAG: AsmA family protein [Gammaproteobacteria bacterium]|nr:MAG: AsmA family protein [Gammaproteobacteria bacterium]
MRILFKLIILVVIIVIAGLIALPFIVDPNDYKQEISDQVEKATGRTLTLDGDIGLSVFPWIALEMGPLSLSNAKGFKAEHFAKVEAAEIRIKLMPLLQKQLEMDTIVLDGLVLNLEKNKAGKTNWDDLAGSNKPDGSTKESETKSSDGSAPALAAISIAGVKLSNANILWADASTSQSYSLENLNLTTDPLVPGEPTAVEIDFDINSAKPQAKAHINLNTKVIVDLENQQYALTGLEFTTQAEGKELPFSKADISLNGDINADMVEQLVSIDNFSLAIKANKDQQAIDAKLSANVSSNLANQQTTLKAVNLTAVINDPALPGEKAKLNLTADISADMQQQTLTLSTLVLELQDLLISGDINASKLLSDNPNFAGQIDIKPFNLRQLANKLAIELPPMADGSTLELVQVKTAFEGSTQHFNAKQLDVTLDQSKLTGNLAVDNFAKPAINFKLALDEIDIDRYLPPVSKEEKPTVPVPPATTAAAGASELPLETLRQINVKGILDIGKLKVSGTHSEKIHLEINAADGLIKLNPISANMYQGQYQGNVSLDARGKTLKLTINENLKDVQVGPLLKDLSGDDKISGTANAQAKLTGNGATVDQIKQTLTGNGKFSFTDGALKGINVAESIRKAKAALKGEKLPASDAPLQTDFSSLTGSFTATNGIINNQDLLAKSPLLRINGTGMVDLPKEGIDYTLKVSIVGTTKGQDATDLADLEGLTIPVNITGTFAQPKPTVDIANLLKEQATEEMKAKVADKLEDKLGSDLGGLLGGALGTKKSETTATEPTSKTAETAPTQEAPAESAEDILKNKLKSLF